MATAYNGWPAAPGWSVAGGQLEPLVIAGEAFSPGVLAGDVHDVFEYVFNRVHAEVEPVVKPEWHQADDWGYSYRANKNNPFQLSCHAAACACDYNATRHPNGKGGTWAPWQKAKILEILAAVNNVVRVLWGYDEMHFEICKGRAEVAAAAAKVRGGSVTPGPAPVDQWQPRNDAPLGVRVLSRWCVGSDVAFVQRWHGLNDDGYFGSATEQAVRTTQQRNGKAVDGVVGPETWALLGIGGPRPTIPPVPAAPAWDLPRGHYLGHISGPAASRGGGTAPERDNVLWVQQMFIKLGCVPGVGDWRDKWADGRWETATTVACQTFYAKFALPVEKYNDRIYSDDYRFLMGLR